MTEMMPTVRLRNKDEQRLMKRDDETPSPYSFTKSDIEQLDMEENEETIAAFKVNTHLLVYIYLIFTKCHQTGSFCLIYSTKIRRD